MKSTKDIIKDLDNHTIRQMLDEKTNQLLAEHKALEVHYHPSSSAAPLQPIRPQNDNWATTLHINIPPVQGPLPNSLVNKFYDRIQPAMPSLEEDSPSFERSAIFSSFDDALAASALDLNSPCTTPTINFSPMLKDASTQTSSPLTKPKDSPRPSYTMSFGRSGCMQ